MSNSAAALKEAVEFEKKALEKYQEATALVKHEETKETLQKLTTEKQQTIESMHWIIMAEAGKIETEKPAAEAEGEEAKSGASKCPFSGLYGFINTTWDIKIYQIINTIINY